MYAWIDVITVVILIAATNGIWKIAQAFLFRLTGSSEKYATTWAIVMVTMAALCGLFYAIFLSYPEHASNRAAEWAFFAMCYCGLVAGSTLVGFVFTYMASMFGRLIGAVRGD